MGYRLRRIHNWIRIFRFENIFQWSRLVPCHLEIMSLTTTHSVLIPKTKKKRINSVQFQCRFPINYTLHRACTIIIAISYENISSFSCIDSRSHQLFQRIFLHRKMWMLCSLPHSHASYCTEMKCLFIIVCLAFSQRRASLYPCRGANTETECFVRCMNSEQTTTSKTFLCSLAYMTIICQYVVRVVFTRWKIKWKNRISNETIT